MRFGHSFVGDFAAHHIDAAEQCRLAIERVAETVVGERLDEPIRHVGQCLRRRARIAPGMLATQ